MELIETMRRRRSVRQYTGAPVPEEKIERILQAGLLSASGKAKRPWAFIVVRDKETLKKLAGFRAVGAGPLEGADCAIVTVAAAAETDVWIEDCSVAMAQMHLMADSLGLGSCWIQGRLREAADGRTSEEYVRALLGVPQAYALEAVLALGVCADHPAPYALEELPTEKIHRERF